MSRLDWDYRDGLPVDFVWHEGGIGVEFGEWLDHEQTRWVAERDRLREQIELEVERRGLRQFQGEGQDPRCTVQVDVDRLPGRADKAQIIDELIRFMVEFETNHNLEIYQPNGHLCVSRSQLPQGLSLYFTRLSFFGFLYGGNLGVPVMKAFVIGQPLQADSALRSLRETLSTKIVEKGDTYRVEKQRLGLSELWLVVHYSSPGVFNAPLLELRVEVGYGVHRMATQERVANMAKALLRELGELGAFDRVFFLICCITPLQSMELRERPHKDYIRSRPIGC
jgi:hypothetical protein